MKMCKGSGTEVLLIGVRFPPCLILHDGGYGKLACCKGSELSGCAGDDILEAQMGRVCCLKLPMMETEHFPGLLITQNKVLASGCVERLETSLRAKANSSR